MTPDVSVSDVPVRLYAININIMHSSAQTDVTVQQQAHVSRALSCCRMQVMVFASSDEKI